MECRAVLMRRSCRARACPKRARVAELHSIGWAWNLRGSGARKIAQDTFEALCLKIARSWPGDAEQGSRSPHSSTKATTNRAESIRQQHGWCAIALTAAHS